MKKQGIWFQIIYTLYIVGKIFHIFSVFAKEDFQACLQLLSQKYNYEQVIKRMQSPEIQMRLSQPYFVQRHKHNIIYIDIY